jgi:hypothetical protein
MGFVFRILKSLDFQPRMGLVTRTMAAAMGDLLHFCILFMFVYLGYAIVGHFLFGPAHASCPMSPACANLVEIRHFGVLNLWECPCPAAPPAAPPAAASLLHHRRRSARRGRGAAVHRAHLRGDVDAGPVLQNVLPRPPPLLQ